MPNSDAMSLSAAKPEYEYVEVRAARDMAGWAVTLAVCTNCGCFIGNRRRHLTVCHAQGGTTQQEAPR